MSAIPRRLNGLLRRSPRNTSDSTSWLSVPASSSVPVWAWGLRIIAQSTGVSVRATRPDRMMDVAIVIPNWR